MCGFSECEEPTCDASIMGIEGAVQQLSSSYRLLACGEDRTLIRFASANAATITRSIFLHRSRA